MKEGKTEETRKKNEGKKERGNRLINQNLERGKMKERKEEIKT